MSKKTWLSGILFMLSIGLLFNTSWATSEMVDLTKQGTDGLEAYCVKDPVTKKITPDTMRYTYDNGVFGNHVLWDTGDVR